MGPLAAAFELPVLGSDAGRANALSATGLERTQRPSGEAAKVKSVQRRKRSANAVACSGTAVQIQAYPRPGRGCRKIYRLQGRAQTVPRAAVLMGDAAPGMSSLSEEQRSGWI